MNWNRSGAAEFVFTEWHAVAAEEWVNRAVAFEARPTSSNLREGRATVTKQ